MLRSQTKVVGSLQFLTPQTDSSLYRNDKVLMVRNDQGSFVRGEGVETEKHLLPIYDARQLTNGGKTAIIKLDNQEYTLRITKNAKLILSK